MRGGGGMALGSGGGGAHPLEIFMNPKRLWNSGEKAVRCENGRSTLFFFFLLVREVGNVGSSIGIPTLCVEIWRKEIWGRNINVSKFFAVNSDYV